MYGNNRRETLEQVRERNQREYAERQAAKQAEADRLKAANDQAIANAKARHQAEEREKQEALAARLQAQQADEERREKLLARGHYKGTDAAFEADWPGIRAKLAADRIAEGQRHDQLLSRRLSEF